MRRICCFCESWESGGIESFLNNILLKMDLSQIQVDIVASELRESVFTPRLKQCGVDFIELSGKLRSAENYRLFRELLKKKNYDVIHFNLYQGMSLYYVQMAKNLGVPVRIAHSHNSALRKSRGRWLKQILHNGGKLLWTSAATDLWACSGIAADFLFNKKALSQKEYTFIPNGIEVERFRFDPVKRYSVRAELGLTDEFVIGNVGRLCYQKNQSFLLDVFYEFLKQCPDSRLLLVGEGEDREKLKEKAERLSVSDKVIFYGTTNNTESLLSAFDVFAFPSLFEGLGIVAIEAQASGLPILCSENVPKEVNLTQLVRVVPIINGVQQWADELFLIKQQMLCSKEVNIDPLSMFEVATVARKIENKYLATDKSKSKELIPFQIRVNRL